MKKLIAVLAVASLFGCAGLQTKLKNAKNKASDAYPKVECRAEVILPYVDYILEADLPAILDGLQDIDYVLEVAGVVSQEAKEVKAAFAACGKL